MKKASLLLAVGLAGWLSAPLAQAHKDKTSDTTTTTTSSGSTSGDLTGTFTASDGTTGTYVETKVTVGTTTTDTVVYTSTDLTETGTDTTAVTTNTDGSKVVVYTHLALGATVPSTVTIDFAAPATTTTTTTTTTACANAGIGVTLYGTGTFTAADGTIGTLTAFATVSGGSTVTSIDFTSTLLGLTRELRVEGGSGDEKVFTTSDVTAAGVDTVTTLTLTRGSTHHHHH